MPTLMVMVPPPTEHSRAVWPMEAWKRRLVALASAPGAFTDSVAAPEGTSTLGQSRSGLGGVCCTCAAAACWVGVPKKNAFMRSRKDEPPDGLALGEAGCDVPNQLLLDEHADSASASATAK